jgi:hypothetical protein
MRGIRWQTSSPCTATVNHAAQVARQQTLQKKQIFQNNSDSVDGNFVNFVVSEEFEYQYYVLNTNYVSSLFF